MPVSSTAIRASISALSYLVLPDALDDGVHLILREGFEDGLGGARSGDEVLNLGVRRDRGLLSANAGGGDRGAHGWFPQ